MFITDGVDNITRASMLVRQLINEHDPKFGVGSMTCSIYDTAWVSMITKSADGQTKWLFPSCFHYLLEHQQRDGGWATAGSDGDAILNTLAALLAICKHLAAPHQITSIPTDELQYKKDRAIYFLEAKFAQWDVASTTSQHFEIFIPKLLQLLQQEGIGFTFPGQDLLFQKRDKTAVKIDPTTLYKNRRNILTQSLEGLVGEVDFDRLRHHKISGSMMASPASTAAYLMHCSTWDDEAESYLIHVVSVGGESSTGGVPSKYPSTVFEVTITLSLLLENGFTPSDLSMSHLDSATNFLDNCLALESGVTGFAPCVESDADNTARAISTLSQLGRTPSLQGLIARYGTKDFFKTYTQNRNPNFRTNCLVLKSLLDLVLHKQEQQPQIETCTKFIANCWWTTNGQIVDNLNNSPNYATMLMAQTFVRLIDLYDRGLITVLDDSILRDKVLICLFQALVRTLQTQNSDGSWGRGQRCETTSYALITLTRLSVLSSSPRIRFQAARAIENARCYLSKNFRPSTEADHMWNEKTVSGSRVIFQAYVLAALQATTVTPPSPCSIEQRSEVPLAKIAIQTKYYSRQPWFANMPEWQIQAFLVESYLVLPQLKAVQYAVFPQDTLAEDRYFDSIPFGWIAAGCVERRFIGAEYLYQMMILTFLNRQLVEYIDHVLREIFSGCLFEIEDVVHDIFEELEDFNPKDQCFCDGHPSRSSISTSGTISLSEARSVLYRYVSHILNHPYVLMASHHDQAQLRSELLTFLLGHLSQSSDEKESSGIEDDALARTTGTSSPEQTSHQLMFAFLSCIVGNQSPNGAIFPRKDFLETPDQHYLAADLCRRLSILSFLSHSSVGGTTPEAPYRELKDSYRPFSLSDYKRESCESSISSASATSSTYSDSGSPVSPISSVSSAPSMSPTRGFCTKTTAALMDGSTASKTEPGTQLKRLLRHERRCLDICLETLLEAETDLRTFNVIKLFVDLSELSDQIFSDPNLASSLPVIDYSIPERPQSIEDPDDNFRPPTPPKKAERRGSVSAARAALEIAPLKPKRDSESQLPPPELPPKFPAVISRTRSPSRETIASTAAACIQDDIMLRGTTTTQREWNFNKENKALKSRKASKSSLEINRIERVMADMDGVKEPLPSLPRNFSRPKTDDNLPNPKINPVLPVHPALRNEQKMAEPAKSTQHLKTECTQPDLPEPPNDDEASVLARPSFSSAATSFRPVRGRVGSFSGSLSGSFSGSFSSRKSAEERLQAKIRSDERRRRNAIEFQFNHSALYGKPSKPARSARKTGTELKKVERSRRAMTEPIALTIKEDPLTPVKQVSESEGRGDQGGVNPPAGWVKAPLPIDNNGEASLDAERNERLSKLKRASRLGGPRWRAPF